MGRIRTNFLFVSAVCFLLLPAVGCSYDLGCEANTEEELSSLAASADCPGIRIVGTSLTSLAGLEKMSEPKGVEISLNPVLVDIAAADGASSIVLGGENESLTDVDLTLGASFISQNEPVRNAKLIYSATEDLLASFHPSPAALKLDCASVCDLRIGLEDVDGMTITVGDGVRSTVAIESSAEDWTPLQGLGLPLRIQFYGEQDAVVLAEYRSWLDSEGFEGLAERCFDDGTCAEI